MTSVFVTLLVSLFTASWAFGATYHVQKAGSSDGNPCTASAPCLTIGKGLSVMSGGDTLLLHAGTYAEGNLAPPSGSSGAPTLLKAVPGETVILRPNNKDFDTIINFQSGRRYITLDGLVLDASGLTSFPIYGAADVAHLSVLNGEIKNGLQSGMLIGGTHWEIRNNHIHHNGQNCCATGSDDHGIYLSAGYSRIIGNRFNNNACYNVQNYGGSNPTENVYDGNTFTASKCGVTLTKGRNHLFINNVIYDDSTFYERNALLIFAPGTKVYNNTFSRINILTVNEGDASSVQIRNNLVVQGSLQTTRATTSNNLLTGATFVNAGAGDFHLAPDSAAIDAGMRVSEVTTDLDGVARPQGAAYDIGAYEYRSGGEELKPLPAPTGLRLILE